jgi:hypothetical protein
MRLLRALWGWLLAYLDRKGVAARGLIARKLRGCGVWLVAAGTWLETGIWP